MKGLILGILLLPVVAFGGALQDAVIKEAKNLSRVRERTNRNDAPEIDRMLAYQGLPPRLSWCLAYCVWCYHVAADSIRIRNPLPKVARCSLFWNMAGADPWRYRVIRPEDVAWGERLQPADVAIFSHNPQPGKANWDGHAALVERQLTATTFRTWEGNTTPGPQGNQR
ncbi:MAG: hypothetical protein ACM31P_02235, partial [Actinomycetota bacterium]